MTRTEFRNWLNTTYAEPTECSYWYPLKKVNDKIPVIDFDSEELCDEGILKGLLQIFTSHGIHEMFVLPEFEEGYSTDDLARIFLVEDEDGYGFPYASEEFYCDDSLEWVIYCSHESTVTFGGQWLVEEVRKLTEGLK